MAKIPQITTYNIIATAKRKSRNLILRFMIIALLFFSVTAGLLWNHFTPAVASEVLYSTAWKVGGTSADVSYGIAVDGDGNVYHSGGFMGTADFDPGAGTTNLVSVGSTDVFVAKYSPGGTLLWAKSFGGTNDDYSYGLTIDNDGNVYPTGYFNLTADFDPGAGIVNIASAGGADIFIVKLDTDGNYMWAKTMGGTSSDYSYSVKVDSSGNVYSGGVFASTADFDPGAGVLNLVAVGGSDPYIAKLDMNGDLVWAKGVGSASFDATYHLALDVDNNVMTTGQFFGTVDFDPGAGVSNLTSNGNGDIYVWKLDTDGNYVWAKNLGGTFSDTGYSIGTDSDGNVYTTGSFGSTADFDPGAGTANLSVVAGSDVFVSKLDSNGNYVWAKSFGGDSGDVAYALTVDGDGAVYTTGTFRNTPDFDPGAGIVGYTSVGQTDMFVSKLDTDGNYVWAQAFGGINIDSSVAIALDSNNNVYPTGAFIGTVDFDPGAGVSSLVSSGSQDVFISQLTQTDIPTIATESASAITTTTATIQGDINNTGNLDITDRGFDYGLTAAYTDQIGEVGTFGLGDFTADLVGLTCNTTYHYRAYATNSEGTDTGSDQNFTTSACAVPPSGGGGGSSGSRTDDEDETPPGLTFPPDYTPPLLPTPTPPYVVPPAPPITTPVVTQPVTTIKTPDPVAYTNPTPATSTPVPPANTVSTPSRNEQVPPPATQPRSETPRIPQSENNSSVTEVLKSYRNRVNQITLLTIFDLAQLDQLLPTSISGFPLLALLALLFLGFGLLRMIYLGYLKNLFSVLGLRKKRRVWGTLYDSKTKQPLDPAVVELIDASTGKVQERAITDLAGRFGFLVTPGTFTIRASKTHYTFPSKQEAGETDEIYDHLYHGEQFAITDSSSLITPNIPMDATAADWNQEAKKQYLPSRERLQYALQFVLNALFSLGFIFAVVNYILNGGLWNGFVLVCYIIVILTGWLLKPKRLWGRLTKNGRPMGGVKIELLEPQLGVVMGKSLTASDGKFFLKVPQTGQYKIVIRESGAETPFWQSAVKVGRESVLNQDIVL